ncbi:Riboflavin biosynthesis protein RibBA [Streptomyces californicus]
MIGNIIGLIALALGWRRSIWTWPAQLLSGVILLVAFASAHLSGSAGKQLVVIVVALWGWWSWNRGRQQAQDGSIAVRFATWRERGVLIGAAALGTALAGPRPNHRGPALPRPVAATRYTFVGTVVAMYAQARGMVEFWFASLLVDLVGVPLNFANGFAFSGFVYVIYGALVLWGMRDWWRRSRTPALREPRHDRPARLAAPLHHDPLPETFALDPVEQAVRDIAAGRPVVVVDDEDRENEGDLVIAAEKATPEIVAFMMSECRGLIGAPMESDELERLELPQMVAENTESMQTAFTVSVDASAAHGVTTGISAAYSCATTRRTLAGGVADPGDCVPPGHVFPLRARAGGVLVRDGHTEAAVDLARLAGLRPAGAIVEIAGEDGVMLRLPELIPYSGTTA